MGPIKGRDSMGRFHGHRQVRENKWAASEGAGHFTGHFTTSSEARRDKTLTGPSPPLPLPTTASPLTSSSAFGLQTAQTTEPRPVFSLHNSYAHQPSTSSIKRQPAHTEFYVPRSNSDLLVGSMNQRDQYTMDTPLNAPSDTPLPPSPPLLSGGRLGAIIILCVQP